MGQSACSTVAGAAKGAGIETGGGTFALGEFLYQKFLVGFNMGTSGLWGTE